MMNKVDNFSDGSHKIRGQGKYCVNWEKMVRNKLFLTKNCELSFIEFGLI